MGIEFVGMEEKRILEISAYVMIISGVITMIVELGFKVEAAYGRYADAIKSRFKVNGRIGWIVQEAPSFIIASIYFWKSCNFLHDNGKNQILLLAYCIHYFHRSFIFPLFIQPRRPNPLMTILFAFTFCIWNGYMQGASLTHNIVNTNSFIYFMGLLLFVTGAIVNIRSDYYLISLRKNKTPAKDYAIPEQGLFKLISCPNYFGEIVEWIGYGMASGRVEQIAFAFFTIANLLPRAIQHHNYYKTRFTDYPRTRKALIPFIL